MTERAELHETTKRTMSGLSHAVEEITEAAGSDATVVALFQHGAYYAPMRRRYERLAAGGATVIVGYAGETPTAGRVHHVSLGTTARILIDRLEMTQRELATTRSALAVETDITTRDPLTGLLNREGLERWLGGPESDGLPMPPMGVILIDLDGFKAINDTRGHLVGDQLLCGIADALLETTRPADVAARWGGDEFIVLCPHAADGELSAIAGRLLDAVAAVEADGARVSASAGIKTCSQRPLPLGDADTALYAAKAAGGAQFAMRRRRGATTTTH